MLICVKLWLNEQHINLKCEKTIDQTKLLKKLQISSDKPERHIALVMGWNPTLLTNSDGTLSKEHVFPNLALSVATEVMKRRSMMIPKPRSGRSNGTTEVVKSRTRMRSSDQALEY